MPDSRVSQVRFEALACLPCVFPTRRGLSAGSHAPRLPRFNHGLVPSQCFGDVPALCPAPHCIDGTAKCPESLCPVAALPLLEDVSSIPARTLLPGHRSYGLIRQSLLAPLAFGYWPRARNLRRLLPAPAANGIFPTLSLRILPRMPGPLRRRYHEVHIPVSSSVSSAFPMK